MDTKLFTDSEKKFTCNYVQEFLLDQMTENVFDLKQYSYTSVSKLNLAESSQVRE